MLAAMPSQIRIERNGPIASIVFDHPERRNAMTAEMWAQIPPIAQELDGDDAVRVVVLRGAGDVAFVSGADISQFGEQRTGEKARDYEIQNTDAFGAIESIGKPVIAAIHGFCIGGGFAIALTADLRYAADDAQFAIPAARLGLGYNPPGLATLARVVGEPAAKELFLTARRFKAEEAAMMGLVNRVMPKAKLDDFIDETARQIAENAPLTLRAAKAAFRDHARPLAERHPQQVEKLVLDCFESEDYGEGVDAFMNKRRPAFKGR